MEKTGYSQEEAYFYKLNKELIEKKRKELDASRSASTSSRPSNWMKCPKCGGEMNEKELSGIKIDQCLKCQGIYFDHGELEILLESREPKGFLGAIKSKLF